MPISPWPAGPGCRRRCRRRSPRSAAPRGSSRVARAPRARPCRTGVGQGLLHDAVGGQLDAEREVAAPALDVDVHPQSDVRGLPDQVGQPAQRGLRGGGARRPRPTAARRAVAASRRGTAAPVSCTRCSGAAAASGSGRASPPRPRPGHHEAARGRRRRAVRGRSGRAPRPPPAPSPVPARPPGPRRGPRPPTAAGPAAGRRRRDRPRSRSTPADRRRRTGGSGCVPACR